MAEEKRISRFTSQEEDLIRNTFKDREDLLIVLRKVFYQAPLNAMDLSLLELSFKSKPLLAILRRLFLPVIEVDLPISAIGGQSDAFTHIPVNQLLPEGAVGHIKAVDLYVRYTDQQIKVLESGNFAKTQEINFADLSVVKGKGDTDIYLNIFARSIIVTQVEKQLMTINAIAEKEEPTVEELEERKKKDSNK